MSDEPGVMNICIEDCLAMASEDTRHLVLQGWLLLGAEYAARW